MQVRDVKARLQQIEVYASALHSMPAASLTPELRGALAIYDQSLKQAVRGMLTQIDGSSKTEVDVTTMAAQLGGKIDAFLTVTNRCPAMQVFREQSSQS
jgi:hypothetical protein